MRERLLKAFDAIWIDNLHGNRIISERTPNGNSCETIFAVRGQSTGIKLGTAITTLVKRQNTSECYAQVLYRDVWGMPNDPVTWGRAERKRAALGWSSSLTSKQLVDLYQTIQPSEETYFALVPHGTEDAYALWPALDKIFANNYPGVKTSRDPDLVSIDAETLRERMQHYFDVNLNDQEVAKYAPVLMQDVRGHDGKVIYDAKATRRELLKNSKFREEHLIPVAYRPFDNRWLYWESKTKLLDRNRVELFEQVFPGNLYLEAVRQQRRSDRYDHGVVIARFMDLNFVDGGARCFPLYERQLGAMFEERRSNFKVEFLTLLSAEYGQYPKLEKDLFYHIVAILNTPNYREENVGDIEQDWPHIPIPKRSELLIASAMLGQQVANLLRPEIEFRAPDQLCTLAVPTRIDGKQLSDADLRMTVRYNGIGRYKLQVGHDGSNLGRLWWNDVAYWNNVPQDIWNFTIGGYPVLKKWLDYRHVDKLGRPLHVDEVLYLTEIVQRIAVLLALGSSLNANYAAIKGDTLAI